MIGKCQQIFTIQEPINNEFDRQIVRRKINKIESLDKEIFITIKKHLEKEKEFVIEYEGEKLIPLRRVKKQKQWQIQRSKLSRLPYVFKENSISTRISISNIYVNEEGGFVYYLNLKEFDISPKQENGLLEKMYMMEWETIISIVGGKTPPKQHNSPQSLSLASSNQKSFQNTSLPKVQQNKPSFSISQSKKFFTSSNKPQPRSKQDFNTLKSQQYQNIINLNHEYINDFIDILSDQKPTQTRFTQTTSSRNTGCKSTRSY